MFIRSVGSRVLKEKERVLCNGVYLRLLEKLVVQLHQVDPGYAIVVVFSEEGKVV